MSHPLFVIQFDYYPFQKKSVCFIQVVCISCYGDQTHSKLKNSTFCENDAQDFNFFQTDSHFQQMFPRLFLQYNSKIILLSIDYWWPKRKKKLMRNFCIINPGSFDITAKKTRSTQSSVWTSWNAYIVGCECFETMETEKQCMHQSQLISCLFWHNIMLPESKLNIEKDYFRLWCFIVEILREFCVYL